MTVQIGPKKHSYNLAQLRINTWNRLKTSINKLMRTKENSEAHNTILSETKVAMGDLKIIEQYFAFPGKEGLKKLQGMLSRKEYAAFRHKVNELVTVLVSESYRSNLEILEHGKKLDQDSPEKNKSRNLQARYFEVLMVDNVPEAESKAVNKKLKKLRNSSESFVYKVVYVKSFQDALMALLFNPNIQACIIRYGFPYKSKFTNGILEPYINKVKNLDFHSFPEYELGPILGKITKHFRPEIDLYLGTDSSPVEIRDSTLEILNAFFTAKKMCKKCT